MYDCIVIGGGAAGLLAAGTCAERGKNTLLIEHGDYTGKKLRITGKGRCNVCNNCSGKDVILNIPTGGKFMTSALYAFPPENVMSFFEELGVKLKTERGNRVFPESDKASDVVEALRKYVKKSGVHYLHADVTDIVTEDGRVTGVVADGKIINSYSVILCTGGMSYPLTGSTGDGYKMAAKLGHTVIPPKPSLVPLETEEDCSELQGLTLKNVKITVRGEGKKPVYEDQGEMLFTHFGVSGPLILSASSHMRDFEKNNYVISIDMKPALDEKTLDNRILRDFEKYSNRNFANSLCDLTSRLMIPIIVRRSGIDPEEKVNSITREERRRLVELFKSFTLNVTRPRPVDEAIITSGGIKTAEINPKTMESKLVGGLFFAGEVIDVDAYTGGFNLQVAWSTARMAGLNV